MSLALRHLPADVLGLAPLSKAVLAGRPEPAATPGLRVPRALVDLAPPEERWLPDERRELAGTLERALAAYEPHVAVLEAARSLATPGAALVLAGQQPGFLGGPLYNLWKALHALRLARALGEAWDVPVVAGFWNHADDHDVAEVHHAWIRNPHLDLQKVALGGLASGKRPVGEIVLDDERHRLPAIRELLTELLGDGPATREALERFLPRSGETFAHAFTRALLELFGHAGLVVIEPEWIREPLSRALARVVGAGVRAPLDAGVAALRAAGHEPAIDPGEAALVFHHVRGERQALRLAPDGFRYDDEPGSRSPGELAAEIVQSPAEWSAGALLRPLVQDLALPVAAYVGGWGELAYHAELPPLRAAVDAPATPFVPRLSATLLEPAVEDSLASLQTDVGAVLRARSSEEAPSDADEDEEPRLVAELGALRERLKGELAGLEDELRALEPALLGQLRRAARDADRSLERLSGKVERVHANRAGRGRRHLRRVDAALVPRGEPQERVLSAFEACARHGTAWLDQLQGELEPLPTEHLVVRLDDADHRGDAPGEPSA